MPAEWGEGAVEAVASELTAATTAGAKPVLAVGDSGSAAAAASEELGSAEEAEAVGE